MEWLKSVWEWVLPIGGGVTIGAVFLAIGSVILRSTVSKLLGKIDVKGVAEKVASESVEKVKVQTFTHNIEPIVKSEMVKVGETISAEIAETVNKLVDSNAKLLAVVKAGFAYFDNSIAITDEQKSALKQAIAEAEQKPQIAVEPQNVAVSQIVKDEPNTAHNENMGVKTPKEIAR